jgi:hypothetical protein
VKEELNFKKTNKRKNERKKNPYKQRKKLYTNEDNSSSDDSDSEVDEILFMGLETQKNEYIDSIAENNFVKASLPSKCSKLVISPWILIPTTNWESH